MTLVVVRADDETPADLTGQPLIPVEAKSAPADARTILDSALRDFDKAVSLQNHRSDEAKALYRSALAGFESLLTDGRKNGYLYYNIANTYMRLGDVGRAIANYRRAHQLIPGDPDVARNLAFARTLCELRVEPKPTTAILRTILFWHFEYSPAARTKVAIAAYALFWTVMLVMLFLKRRVPALVGTAVVLGIVAAAAGGSVLYESSGRAHDLEGVIVADEAVLRKGNGEAYDPQLDRPLPEGVEFQILETRAGGGGETWHHIELPDGNDGWLRADQIETF